jgi:hypothetical protein
MSMRTNLEMGGKVVRLQFTQKGVGVMAAMFFTDGWITEEQYIALADLVETWDWNNPVCQHAFADTKPASCQALEANIAQKKALAEKLGRPLTEHDLETLGIAKGPLYEQNQLILKAWEEAAASRLFGPEW